MPEDAIALPDTPIDRVLDFRERRSDELAEFRSAMDSLYQEVVNSADIPHAKTAAVQKIERSISNLERSTRESFPTRFLSSLKVELNLPSLAVTAAASATFASTVGIAPWIGGGVGAIAASIKFDLAHSGVPHGVSDNAAFAYVLSGMRELK
jgi:hypothetical protein